METYITIYKTDGQWEISVWLRKLNQRLCINLERWDGEGEGREVQEEGGKSISMADSLRLDRKQQNFVNQLSFK